ncbi:helix-turn-helix domain-containing protein [Thalassomonas viridans]|uniref:Helix-turn-helix domain-containing protein n=1 Tax=Thalassomonas viridans TaxID=137584 RepID=A0AAF0C9X6_9GAMM|nr:helix-turn-helix domain-containing protein [Thalassomonas viridans]WDE06268.1 helix-turn-helix domain-containing protein [Thalassomonas viridans]
MDHFSIRSYSNEMRGHFHEYHQLVLPLHGSIHISVGEFSGPVSPGDCVIIKAGQRHDFRAPETARFLVLDTGRLPDNLMAFTEEKFAVNAPLMAFVHFIEQQLQHQVNRVLESLTYELFYQLLAQQTCVRRIDKRIGQALEVIAENLGQTHSLTVLARVACLSPTQFKKVFKQSLGVSFQVYLTRLRMEKAKALLTHTDIPVSLVAERVGYQNASAFSRRFRQHFGTSPKTFVR